VFRRVWVVMTKELTDNLRDRRSTLLSLIYPLIGPILLGVLIILVGESLTAPRISEHVVVAKGIDQAPDFVQFVHDQGADIVDTEIEDVAGAVRSGIHASVLVFPDNYAALRDSEKTAQIEMFVDSSRLSSIMSISRTLELVNQFNRRLADQRLALRDIAPEVAYPLEITSVNVAASVSITGVFLNMMAPFLIFTVFLGGVYMAIDTTAGERERGSLEPLLINPVPRWQFMVGKYLASLAFTAIAVLAGVIAYKVIFEVIQVLGVGFNTNPSIGDFALIFGLCVPMMMLAVAIQIIIATVSKSFKETQTLLGLLPLLPSLPGMIMVFVPLQAKTWMMLVPTYGQTLLISQIVRGDAPATGDLLLASAATVVWALALCWLAARLYEREQVAFAG
jgi:sodium transport system permease protein